MIGPVKPSPFVYHAPLAVGEATAVLAELGSEAKVLAGGQSLIPVLNMRLAAPAHLVDINRVGGLDDVDVTDEGVRVGALVRHAELERHDKAYAAQPLLRQALRHVAHPAIRNRGTTVGSLAHADPAGEMPAVLVLTDGHVEVTSVRGSRNVPAREFFLGPMESCLAPDELATAAWFGRAPDGTGTAFTELARRSGDYALAAVGAAVTVRDGTITAARASFVSVTPTPDVLDLTPVLAGLPVDTADWEAAGDLARGHVEPESDIHATAEYRRHLVGVLTGRVLREAARNATRQESA
jgi:aerobic carbon-monoxide dehydrogenase medium subunit